MPNKLHGRATTTPLIRKQIQESTDTIKVLAKRYNINQNTVLKWKNRKHVTDLRPGPPARSKALTRQEEAAVVAFRKHTLLPLDDCLYTLRKILPKLTRSCLYRCFKRHGINRLPHLDKKPLKKEKKHFKKYMPGYVHVDITQVYTEEGKLYLFVAIDRTTKFCFALLYNEQTAKNAVDFVQRMVKHFPNIIHKILTDNGLQFTYHDKIKRQFHPFFVACKALNIEHRLTRAYHPWTNGQVERMNRTIKEGTVKKYFYRNHETLSIHLRSFLDVYNYTQKLKTLEGMTPFEKCCLYLQSEEGKGSKNLNYEFSKPYMTRNSVFRGLIQG